MAEEYYPEAGQAVEKLMVPQHITARERLNRKKANLQAQLAAVQQALVALDNNPGAEDVLNAIGKAL